MVETILSQAPPPAKKAYTRSTGGHASMRRLGISGEAMSESTDDQEVRDVAWLAAPPPPGLPLRLILFFYPFPSPTAPT